MHTREFIYYFFLPFSASIRLCQVIVKKERKKRLHLKLFLQVIILSFFFFPGLLKFSFLVRNMTSSPDHERSEGLFLFVNVVLIFQTELWWRADVVVVVRVYKQG